MRWTRVTSPPRPRTPFELLAEVSRLGGAMIVRDGALRVRGRLPAGLRTELRERKLELVAALTPKEPARWKIQHPEPSRRVVVVSGW